MLAYHYTEFCRRMSDAAVELRWVTDMTEEKRTPATENWERLLSLVTPEVVIMTAYGAISDNKLGIMTTLGFQWLVYIGIQWHILFPIDGSAQDCSNSSALAMKLLQSYTEPL